MNRFAFILSAVLFAVIGCSEPPSTSENRITNNSGIIGGVEATAQDMVTASTVSLIFNYFKKPSSFCTGTLISENLVLTATHCFASTPENLVSVSFGHLLPDSTQVETVVKIKSVIVHKDYHIALSPISETYTGYNDIALVLLETPAPSFAKPVAILNDSQFKPRQPLLVAGYGVLQETPVTVNAQALNYARVEIARVFEQIIVTDQTTAKGVCFGDSGGPAFVETADQLIVVGITRGAHGVARNCRQEAELTNAVQYKDYILETAKELGAELPVFVDLPSEL